MDMTLGAAAAAGVWLALLPTGALLLALAGMRLEAANPSTRAVAQLSAGVLAWSVALLVLALCNRFSPSAAGLLGWVVVIAWLALRRPWRGLAAPPSSGAGIAIALLLFTGAAALHAGWPKESLMAERDEAIYTLHAMHLLRTGENRIDMAALGIADTAIASAMAAEKPLELPGIYPTGTRWTFQFSVLPSTWMAQLAATVGDAGLFRVNVVFSLLSGLALLALARELFPRHEGPWPLVVLAGFLLNPAQVWVSRVNLSEPLAQWFAMSGLLLALLAFRARQPRLAYLAGMVLGGAVLVRIDALLMLLLVLAAYPLAWLVSGQRRPDGPWSSLLAGAAIVGGPGIAYYALDVAPYWNDHVHFLRPLFLASLPLLVMSALVSGGRLPPPPPRLVRALLAVVAGLVLVAFAYASLWRPSLADPALVTSTLVPSLVGQRDYRELSLLNLAVYLGWPLLGLSLAGYLMQLRALATAGAALLASVLLGCSLAFLWNPMISPDHIWASRRYLPVVMPGALLMAGFALATWTQAWPRRRQHALALMLGLALAGQMAWTQRSTVFFAEEKGLLVAMRELDARLPADARLVLVDGATLAATMLAGFGRPALPLLDGSLDQAVASHRDLGRCRTAQPCVLLHQPGAFFAGLRTRPLGDVRLARQHISGTPRAPAVATQRGEVHRQITRVDGFMPAMDDRLAGEHRDWRLPEHGFWNDEVGAWGSVRWTNGDAWLHLPALPGSAIDVTLQLPADKGSRLRLGIDGTVLFEGLAAGGRWRRAFTPPEPGPDGHWTLRIESDRFIAADRYGGDDRRTLGIKVEAVRLVAPTPPIETNGAPDYRARLELVSAGVAGTGSARQILFTVRNEGDAPWTPAAEAVPGQAPVQIGVLWLARGAPLDSARLLEQRVALPHRLAPGEDVLVALALDPTGPDGAKLPRADYDVVLSPVREGIAWFHDHGMIPLRIPVQASELK